VFIVVSA